MNLGALGRGDRAAAAAGGFESRGPGDRVYLLAAGVRVRRVYVYALLRAEMLEAPQPTALFRVRPSNGGLQISRGGNLLNPGRERRIFITIIHYLALR